jgi:dipeptidyl aminopeptidase/acylaminoacyl peptidase
LVDAATLTLRQPTDFTSVVRMPNSSGYIAHDLQWQPGGDQLLLAEWNNYYRNAKTHFRLWDTAEDKIAFLTEVGPMSGSTPLYSVIPAAWKPDGTLIAIPKPDGVEIYNPETGALSQEMPLPYDSRDILGIVWPPRFETPIMRLFRCCSSTRLNREGYEELFYSANMTVWSEGRGLLALNWRDDVWGSFLPYPRLAVYSWEGKPVGIPLPGGDGFTAYGWLSPAGGYAATVDADGDGVVWQTDGTPRHFLADTVALAWSADEQKLATVRSDGSLWVIDAQGQLTPVWRPETFADPVPSPNGRTLPMLSWSADGSVLAYRHNGVVRVWRW